MSLKSCLLSSTIGATGTTTIAIPSAWAYSRSHEEYKNKEIKEAKQNLEDDNIRLTGANETLEKDIEEANKAKDALETETHDTKRDLDEQNKQNTTLEGENEQIRTEKNSINLQYSQLSGEYNSWEKERSSVGEKIGVLENENSKLSTQQFKNNNAIKSASKNLHTHVVNRIKESLNELESKNQQDGGWLYSFLAERIGNGGSPLQDEKLKEWSCNRSTWEQEAIKQGIAYCVLKETEASRAVGGVSYSPPWTTR